MAYTKQVWADGPTGATAITAARLDHIELGLVAIADEIAALRAIVAEMTTALPVVPSGADPDAWASSTAVVGTAADLWVLGSAPGTADDPVPSQADPDLYTF